MTRKEARKLHNVNRHWESVLRAHSDRIKGDTDAERRARCCALSNAYIYGDAAWILERTHL